MTNSMPSNPVIVIGGGPGGLMAAETIAAAGLKVVVVERKPTLGRKFMMAGHGGLNVTHSENFDTFITRYGTAADFLRPALAGFTPQHLMDWCAALGEPTFVGSSGRIFPKSFKASPLLRAWQTRLQEMGVSFIFRAEWQGWDGQGRLIIHHNDGTIETLQSAATVLAMGGASWPRLGADGGWVDILTRRHIAVSPLRPANCGFHVAWSDVFRDKFSGQPLKPVTAIFEDQSIPGELMITQKGIEGGVVYALSSRLREAIARQGKAVLKLDLRPGVDLATLEDRLSQPRGALSFANYLKRAAGLSPLTTHLLREAGGKEVSALKPQALARFIKSLPLELSAPFSLDRAISTAGGIRLDEINSDFMINKIPGTFALGEMLDWEAPTGGYLLQATFSTAVAAGLGVIKYLQK